MTTDPCAEMRLLVQADADGELRPADAARVAVHLDGCPQCALLQTQLTDLSRQIRRDAPVHRAPDTLRARIGALAPARPVRPRLRAAAPVGAGLALAAALLLTVLPPGGDRLPDEIASDHVRALQPGHLLDVVSTDRHTVKPWFAGKLDFAPKVVDLAEQGFPLQGGRLDYVAERPVAVLVYKRREHIVEIYVWPASRAEAPSETRRNGYNLVRWREDQLAFSAVSDLDGEELADFTRLFRSTN